MNILYIGIDPSISCTAVTYEFKNMIGSFYTAHNIKKPYRGNSLYYIFEENNINTLIENFYEKYPIFFKTKKSESYFKNSFLRFNILSQGIVNELICIISKYSPDKIVLTYEDYSYGSSGGLVFDIAEFNMLLKEKLIMKIKIPMEFNLISPKEIKKFATGKGNSDKYGMFKSFNELDNEFIKEMLNIFKPSNLIEEFIPKDTVLKPEVLCKNGKVKKKAVIQKRDKIKIYEEKVKGKKMVIGKSPFADIIDSYFIMDYGKILNKE